MSSSTKIHQSAGLVYMSYESNAKKNNGQICIHLGHLAAVLFKGTQLSEATYNSSRTHSPTAESTKQGAHQLTGGS